MAVLAAQLAFGFADVPIQPTEQAVITRCFLVFNDVTSALQATGL
jgi:hypothetical protein